MKLYGKNYNIHGHEYAYKNYFVVLNELTGFLIVKLFLIYTYTYT